MHDADRENLIAAFRDGDPTALARVWEWCLPQILRGVHSFTGDYDERQELLQVIRIALHESRHGFAGTGNFGAWVQKVSHRRCLQWARTNKRVQTCLSAFEGTVDPLVDLGRVR